jgi:hypothetical protein
MAWYEETLAEQQCPFPDLPDEPCKARTALRVKEVVLQPGTVLENYEWDLPDDQSVAPPEQVTITEQQSVWCFVDRQCERSLDYLELGEERVLYSYPCFSLGPYPATACASDPASSRIPPQQSQLRLYTPPQCARG